MLVKGRDSPILLFTWVVSNTVYGFGCHYIKLHKTIKEREEGYEDGEWSGGEDVRYRVRHNI